MTNQDNNLYERLLLLENEVNNLKMNATENTVKKDKKEKKEKKEKKPRTQTEYNKFVSNYINEQKEKLGNDFNHKAAFIDAAKKWNEHKTLIKETKPE